MLAYATQSRRRKDYADPTFEEMLGLAMDFGLISEVRPGTHGLVVHVLDERLELESDAAAVLLKGLLLGYFYNHSRDDLSLAEWHA